MPHADKKKHRRVVFLIRIHFRYHSLFPLTAFPQYENRHKRITASSEANTLLNNLCISETATFALQSTLTIKNPDISQSNNLNDLLLYRAGHNAPQVLYFHSRVHIWQLSLRSPQFPMLHLYRCIIIISLK